MKMNYVKYLNLSILLSCEERSKRLSLGQRIRHGKMFILSIENFGISMINHELIISLGLVSKDYGPTQWQDDGKAVETLNNKFEALYSWLRTEYTDAVLNYVRRDEFSEFDAIFINSE